MESTETPRTRGTRLRQALIISSVVVAVVAGIRFALWWGHESQQAKLRGRRWPPEALMVFLGR